MTTPAPGASWFGHPRGLSTLFFTEMWERFSYYGMRGFLILYMTKALGFTDPHAGAVYGNYVGSVWVTPILGGLIADRWLGQYRSVLIGGIIIALGHFTLAFHALPFFYVGLTLIVIGTGLLKPNVSALVGALYQSGDGRRDAGFSIFYMGINLGALLGPLIAGKLAEGFDWHLGFACAGVGMLLGLVQYVLGRRRLQPAIDRGILRLYYDSPQEIEVDQHFHKIERIVEEFKPKRVVIDSLSTYGSNLGTQGRLFRDFFHALVALMKEHQIAAVYNHENPEMLGMSSMMGAFGMSSLVDNIILMNWIELGDTFRLGLTVAKMRANPTVRETHECEITDGQGLRVLPRHLPLAAPTAPFSSFGGLISRAPARHSHSTEPGEVTGGQ